MGLLMWNDHDRAYLINCSFSCNANTCSWLMWNDPDRALTLILQYQLKVHLSATFLNDLINW